MNSKQLALNRFPLGPRPDPPSDWANSVGAWILMVGWPTTAQAAGPSIFLI